MAPIVYLPSLVIILLLLLLLSKPSTAAIPPRHRNLGTRPPAKPPILNPSASTSAPVHTTVAPTKRPTPRITSQPTLHPVTFAPTPPLSCHITGSGPINSPSISCQIPFSIQVSPSATITSLSYCASILTYQPFKSYSTQYSNGSTGYWCAVGTPVYRPYDLLERFQWGWCTCNQPPNIEAQCTIRANVPPGDLQGWHPEFQLGPAGATCIFPFTWNGTVYNQCAQINPHAKDPARQQGWCFSTLPSDSSSGYYGACVCAQTLPPTLKPTFPPSHAPMKVSRSPTFGSPVPAPTSSPGTTAPSTQPTAMPTSVPTTSPILSSVIYSTSLVVGPPYLPASSSPTGTSPPIASISSSSPTSQPTVAATAIPTLRPSTHRFSAADALAPKSSSSSFVQGLACILDFGLFSSLSEPPFFSFSVSSSPGSNSSIDCTTCWPKLIITNIYIPDNEDSGTLFESVKNQLVNHSNPIFLQGLWLGGTIYSSTGDLTRVPTNKSSSANGALVAENLYECTPIYLNTSVLANEPTSAPSLETDSSTSSLSGGAVAGIVIVVLCACAFLGVGLVWGVRNGHNFNKDFAEFKRARSTDGGTPHGATSNDNSSGGGPGFSSGSNLPRPPPLQSQASTVGASSPSPPHYVSDFSIDLSSLLLGKVIGSGGNGRIYEAQYAGSAVAVKELFALPGSEFDTDVLFREYDSLRVLKHPHIIQLFGLAVGKSPGTEAPRFFLVMDLAETSLDKVLARKQTEQVVGTAEHKSWALEMARQIASGLSFIHDKGIIHFDVKPHNILLDKSGSVKLCDLGISRLSSAAERKDLLMATSAENALAGTPSYMAPEIIKGDVTKIGPPADVYAFGIVLWQLFHCQSPYPREWSVGHLFDLVCKGNRPQIDGNAMHHPSLQILTKMCWDEDPLNRPKFHQIVFDLTAIDLRKLDFKQVVEAVRYENGDKVRVYSAGLRQLVDGVVQIPPEQQQTLTLGSRKQRVYDVLLSDGSLMVGVYESDLFPPAFKPSSRKQPVFDPGNPLGLNSTSTLAELAGALAIEKHGGSSLVREQIMPLRSPKNPGGARNNKMRFLHRIWKPATTSDSDNESGDLNLPESMSMMAPTPEGPGAPGWGSVHSSPSRGQRHQRMSIDERIMLANNRAPEFAGVALMGDDTRRSLEERWEKSSRGSFEPELASTPLAPTPLQRMDSLNMPAITPFSFRFLPPVDQDQGAAAAAAAGDKSLTFRFDGSRLSLPGLVLSEKGMSVQDVPFPEELDDAESFRKGTMRIAELGRGASGVVYSSLVLSTFRIVAVKEVRFGDRSARHQVVRELKALSRTQSPYIVKMLGAHLDPESECVSMVLEYVNGGSLQDFINVAKGQRLLSERMLVGIAHDMSYALAYCHELGMAHLDVKPSNILLGLDGTAKLADFGLARPIEIDQMAATFVGTTKYLSPERLRGESYAFPADIWGLGMCLLAAALGKYPFDDAMQSRKGEQGVYWSLLEKLETDPVPMLPTDIYSPEARWFCNACLALDASARPTASALCNDAWFIKDKTRTQLTLKTTRGREAGIMVLGEVCEAIVKYLTKTHSTLVHIDPQLLSNLAMQIGLNATDIKIALEQSLSMRETPLSSTFKSTDQSTPPFSPEHSHRQAEPVSPERE